MKNRQFVGNGPVRRSQERQAIGNGSASKPTRVLGNGSARKPRPDFNDNSAYGPIKGSGISRERWDRLL